MTPHKQLNPHRPEKGIYGDCMRTCIACLLDQNPEDVQNFFHGVDQENSDDAWLKLDAYLYREGYRKLIVPYDCSLDHLFNIAKELWTDCNYILMGSSRENIEHAVIACNDKIIHDPSWLDMGVSRPSLTGHYFAMFLIPLHLCA